MKGEVNIDSQELLSLIERAALDKKADDLIILDMKQPSQICDYFIIASGNSTRQVRAISDNIEAMTSQGGEPPLHIEGYAEGTWVLLDYRDIVAHIFIRDARAFYNLERLWADARKVESGHDRD